MSDAISGHGFRHTVVPRCKCGWSGTPTDDWSLARAEFEEHKAKVRHDLRLPEPERVFISRRAALRVVR